MERKCKQAMRMGIIIGIPILSIGVVLSLLYYISVWYANQKVFVINIENVNGIIPLLIGIFLSSIINVLLAIYYLNSQKRIEKLVKENATLSELSLQQIFKMKNELMEAIGKVGGKN